MPASRMRAATSLGLAALLAGCGTTAVPSGTLDATSAPPLATDAPASGASPASQGLLADLDVGDGRTMHLLCVGPEVAGQPTVVFESGLGGDAGQWSDVLRALGGSVRACAYDRAGEGQSPPADAPDGRTTADQVADLRSLLAAADIAPPLLLVGYSLGGWNVLVHADRHPEDVVGAVLVEVRPPAASRRWAALMPPAAPGESESITLTRSDPETFEQDPTGNPEGLRLDDSATETLATAGLGDRPLVVLAGTETAGLTEGFDAALATSVLEVWWELQEELAATSTVGRLERVDGADHELPVSHPDAVADAIREILGD